jgi:hypothetical protein
MCQSCTGRRADERTCSSGAMAMISFCQECQAHTGSCDSFASRQEFGQGFEWPFGRASQSMKGQKYAWFSSPFSLKNKNVLVLIIPWFQVRPRAAGDRPVPRRGAGTSWRAHQAFQRLRVLCREVKGLESLGVGIGGRTDAPGRWRQWPDSLATKEAGPLWTPPQIGPVKDSPTLSLPSRHQIPRSETSNLIH